MGLLKVAKHVSKMQENGATLQHPNVDSLDKFLAAFLEKGFKMNQVEVSWETPYIKYFTANSDIEAGTVVAEWPLDGAVIQVEQLLKKYPLLSKMNDEFKLTFALSSPWKTVFLAVWLALEIKQKSNEFAWILDEMEPDVGCYPRFYEGKKKEALVGSSMERINNVIDHEAMRDHLVLSEFIEDFKASGITKEDLNRAKFYSRRTAYPFFA